MPTEMQTITCGSKLLVLCAEFLVPGLQCSNEVEQEVFAAEQLMKSVIF